MTVTERALLIAVARLLERDLELEFIESGGDMQAEKAWLALGELIRRVKEDSKGPVYDVTP